MTGNLCNSLWGLMLSLFLAEGCGPDSSLIIVDIESRPSTVSSLRLGAELNGKQTMPLDTVPNSVDSFGLLLPAGASGPFLLTADGLDTSGCIIAQGRTDTVLLGQERVRLRLEMATLITPICKPSN